ncbi:MAG: response regulator [Alphaproteobacteria bacterium]|nr:response regulator [Alphaproteobacteria bacterium]MBU1516543.1 response regulator [Alphaproteobacteria bacterium]MBU2094300.1 response regulator [Alphaproteobacteria bacterium]MBU2154123.1 response regulator [Alphaproteobacteria bacterium]MBU2307470.1 response regulator [Alphaproteobacteria bacterium]
MTRALDAAAIVAATDVRGRITHCNDLFCDISGYSRAELIGANHRILNAGHHEPGFFQSMYGVIARGDIWKGTICNRRKSGELYWVDTTIVPQKDAAGRVCGYLAIRFDVTEHVLALQALADARAKAERALDVKARIVANMSHELRTPLTGIIGMAQILTTTALTPHQQSSLSAILDASQSLEALVNDVLKLAQLEAGCAVVETQPTDARAMLQSIAALLTPRAQDKGLTLSLDVSGLPTWLRIDPVRVRQVLTNLIGNAIKFTDAGAVTVHAHWRDGRLNCSVEDTGRGFPPEEKNRLFCAFEQGDDALSRSFGGAGLGLAISSELVWAMDGEIDAESWPGIGSRFHFEIAAPRARQPRRKTRDTPRHADDAPPLQVLVVEDNAMIRQVLQHVLESVDCNVSIAVDGFDAVKAVGTRTFDLCLMDLRMPNMDGRAAATAIRQLPFGRTLQIIAVSADVLGSAPTDADDTLFNGFLSKPLLPERLIEVVTRQRAARAHGGALAERDVRDCA